MVMHSASTHVGLPSEDSPLRSRELVRVARCCEGWTDRGRGAALGRCCEGWMDRGRGAAAAGQGRPVQVVQVTHLRTVKETCPDFDVIEEMN